MTSGQHTKRPDAIKSFRVGDKVITPLGRRATITGCRLDGYLDAAYDDSSPPLAAVILQAETLRRAT